MQTFIPRLRHLSGFPGNPPREALRRVSRAPHLIDLASNENPHGPSPHAIEAVGRAGSLVHRYPDGDGHELREALARHLSVPPGCVVLGNGISELLLLATQAWMERGDTAMVPQNSFPLYEFVVRLADGQSIRIPLQRFRIDLASAPNLVEPTVRLVYLANPNNPTGQVFSHAELEVLLSSLPGRALVLLDEAYRDYAEEYDLPEIRHWIEEDGNVVVLRTFSKVYGLAGLRIGYAVGPERWMQAFEKVRMAYNTNVAAIAAAVAALADEDHRRRCVAANREGRAFLAAAAAKAGYCTLPSQANFLLMEAGVSGDGMARRLLERGIYVRPMQGFGFPGCVRVSVGTREENQIFANVLECL